MKDFKLIPYYRKYMINKDGVVIYAKTGKILPSRKDASGKLIVNMVSDAGNRTTKRPHLLVKELFQ